MRKYGIAIALLLFAGLVFTALAAENTYKFKVTGMHCDMCPMAVEKAAKNVKGVKDVKLTLIEGKWQNGGKLEVKAEEFVKPATIINAIHKADKAYRAEEIAE